MGRLKINLAYSRYPLVEEIAGGEYDFVISREITESIWDILWTDTVKLMSYLTSSGSQRKLLP